MNEYPILFAAPMVRAIRDGSKTQTRRVVKPQPSYQGFDGPPTFNSTFGDFSYPSQRGIRCPYGLAGDRLWVRETFAHEPTRGETWYRADFADGESHNATMLWRPSIFMPRALSRILLEIVSVRVERLQNISREDAIAEGLIKHVGAETWWGTGVEGNGLNGCRFLSPVEAYRALWESINGPGSWDANPFVWVVEFRRNQ